MDRDGQAADVLSGAPAGHDVSATWAVTTPATLPLGSYPLHVSTSRYPEMSTVDYDVTVSVAAPLAAGATGLGDDPWLSADNGRGPVERNTGNGESKAGDGHPIKLGGVTYAKGLGTNAPSTVTYYLAGRCTTVSSTVGLDDEKTGAGSVTFEIWADGGKVADTGLIKRGVRRAGPARRRQRGQSAAADRHRRRRRQHQRSRRLGRHPDHLRLNGSRRATLTPWLAGPSPRCAPTGWPARRG